MESTGVCFVMKKNTQIDYVSMLAKTIVILAYFIKEQINDAQKDSIQQCMVNVHYTKG